MRWEGDEKENRDASPPQASPPRKTENPRVGVKRKLRALSKLLWESAAPPRSVRDAEGVPPLRHSSRSGGPG